MSPPPPAWDEATDPGAGTLEDPFHSIETGIAEATGGRNVYLREGHYVEGAPGASVRYRYICAEPLS